MCTLYLSRFLPLSRFERRIDVEAECIARSLVHTWSSPFSEAGSPQAGSDCVTCDPAACDFVPLSVIVTLFRAVGMGGSYRLASCRAWFSSISARCPINCFEGLGSSIEQNCMHDQANPSVIVVHSSAARLKHPLQVLPAVLIRRLQVIELLLQIDYLGLDVSALL